jgi:AcrR family transcriptional regulator
MAEEKDTKVRSTTIGRPEIHVEPVEPARRAARQTSAGFLSREHVLQATEACFDQAGYDGTTIRAIARQLGCAVGSLYRYFDDKRALLTAMAEQKLAPVIEQLDTGQTDFAGSLNLYLEQVDQNPEAYRLLFWLAAVQQPRSPSPPEPVRQVIDHWANLLGDQSLAAKRWALMHGLIMLDQSADLITDAVNRLGHGSTAGNPGSEVTSEQNPANPGEARYDTDEPEQDITLL